MKRSERGFTLIEILIATAIVTLITGAATMSIFQVVRGAERSNEHITAICQVQNAGYWVSRDVQRAQQVTTDNLTLPDFVIVTWTDWDSNDNHQVVYTLEDMSGSTLKKLQRSESINGGAPNTTFVAQYIDPERTNCEFVNGQLTFTVTATVSLGSLEKSETRVFEVLPRPG